MTRAPRNRTYLHGTFFMGSDPRVTRQASDSIGSTLSTPCSTIVPAISSEGYTLTLIALSKNKNKITMNNYVRLVVTSVDYPLWDAKL